LGGTLPVHLHKVYNTLHLQVLLHNYTVYDNQHKLLWSGCIRFSDYLVSYFVEKMSGFFGLRKESPCFPFKLMELSCSFVNIQLTNRFQGKNYLCKTTDACICTMWTDRWE